MTKGDRLHKRSPFNLYGLSEQLSPLLNFCEAPMHCHWKVLIVKTSFWMLSEVVLNLCGTDTMADYSEFLNARQELTLANAGPVVTLVA